MHGVRLAALLLIAGALTTTSAGQAQSGSLQSSVRTSFIASDLRLTSCCARIGGLIVFDGDSVSRGLRASARKAPDRQLAAMLPAPARVTNVAVSGLPVWKALERYATTVAPLRDPDAPYQLIAFHAGDNDIHAGRTAAQTYTNFAAYVADAHRDGWLVIVTTELQQPTLSFEQQSEISRYDRLLVLNTAKADDVIDFAAYCGFADVSGRGNPAYFSADGVHPSDHGYKLLAEMLLRSMNTLGLFPPRSTSQAANVEPLPPCTS